MIIAQIAFPEFSGISCNMMPFIQGDPESLPKEYRSYADLVEKHYLEQGEVGLLTIDEKYIRGGTSQRGFNSAGINRNVHVEVGYCPSEWYGKWGSGGSGGGWGGRYQTLLHEETMVLIANSISDTCRVWNTLDKRYTSNGDLSAYIDDYPEETGVLLKSGELAKINIYTPHECVLQPETAPRQFFRIIGKGVSGREDYFTINPLMP